MHAMMGGAFRGPCATTVCPTSLLLLALVLSGNFGRTCAQPAPNATLLTGDFFVAHFNPAALTTPASGPILRLVVREVGYPTLPSWLRSVVVPPTGGGQGLASGPPTQPEGTVTVFGAAILNGSEVALRWELEVVAFSAQGSVSWPFSILQMPSGVPTRQAKLRLTNLNISQFLAGDDDASGPLGAFNSALRSIPSNIDLPRNLQVVNVSEGEETPRNVPPTLAADGSLVLPNNWRGRSTMVTVSAFTTTVFPTCNRLRLAGPYFLANGFTIDFDACEAQLTPTAAPTTLTRGIDFGEVDWTRSTKDYEATVVPAVIIAVLLFVICILWFLLVACCCSRRSDRDIQREYRVSNAVRRAREHARRKVSPYTRVSSEEARMVPAARTVTNEAYVAHEDMIELQRTGPSPSYRAPPAVNVED